MGQVPRGTVSGARPPSQPERPQCPQVSGSSRPLTESRGSPCLLRGNTELRPAARGPADCLFPLQCFKQSRRGQSPCPACPDRVPPAGE